MHSLLDSALAIAVVLLACALVLVCVRRPAVLACAALLAGCSPPEPAAQRAPEHYLTGVACAALHLDGEPCPWESIWECIRCGERSQ